MILNQSEDIFLMKTRFQLLDLLVHYQKLQFQRNKNINQLRGLTAIINLVYLIFQLMN